MADQNTTRLLEELHELETRNVGNVAHVSLTVKSLDANMQLLRRDIAAVGRMMVENARSIERVSPDSLALRVPKNTIDRAQEIARKAEESGEPIKVPRADLFGGSLRLFGVGFVLPSSVVVWLLISLCVGAGGVLGYFAGLGKAYINAHSAQTQGGK